MNKWREQLERSITQRLLQQHEDRNAPDEVIHRRVNGHEVLNRRMLVHHTTRPKPTRWLELIREYES